MRFNRMAMQFGVAKHSNQQSGKQEADFARGNPHVDAGDPRKLSFHEMEDVIDEQRKEPAVEASKNFPRVSGGDPHESDFVVGTVQKNPEPAVEVSNNFPRVSGGDPEEQMPMETEVFFEETKDTEKDNVVKEDQMEHAEAADTQNSEENAQPGEMTSHAALTAAAQMPNQREESVTTEEDPKGYQEVMDLLRLIDKHSGDSTMVERYGERWSLRGIIGLPFAQAKTMLDEATDYFAYHVGEIVALAASGKTAGVVIFVDGSSIGVFSGEKILSYRPEHLKKTGRVFKDTIAACGLSA